LGYFFDDRFYDHLQCSVEVAKAGIVFTVICNVQFRWRWLKHCGDIELAGYLANSAGPVPLVLDLRIAHDRVGSSTDPTE
jgi:hypothetical protein